MTLSIRDGGNDRGPGHSLMPPYLVLRDFLDAATLAGLLEYALSRQSDFTPTRVARGADPAIRISAGLHDLGDYRRYFKSQIFDLLPELIAQLRIMPFQPSRFETELVAHGDGAFYTRHIDTQTARYDEVEHLRMLSGVYYFNVEPKVFSGGSLRLYAVGGYEQADFVDIEPLRNSLLVFPSWAPHEVMPVHCPSQRFIDSRFAVNCWIHRDKRARQ